MQKDDIRVCFFDIKPNDGMEFGAYFSPLQVHATLYLLLNIAFFLT